MRRLFLPILGCVLVLSGVLRLGAWAVVAQEVSPEPPVEGMVVSPAVLAAFTERETRLSEQEAQLQSRLRTLELVEQRVSQERAALVQAREDLTATMSQAKSAAHNDVSALTLIYQEMKPEQAAAIFSEMEPHFAAGFLAMMQPPVAAAILAQLEPERAYGVTAIIAGRNLGAPTE